MVRPMREENRQVRMREVNAVTCSVLAEQRNDGTSMLV